MRLISEELRRRLSVASRPWGFFALCERPLGWLRKFISKKRRHVLAGKSSRSIAEGQVPVQWGGGGGERNVSPLCPTSQSNSHGLRPRNLLCRRENLAPKPPTALPWGSHWRLWARSSRSTASGNAHAQLPSVGPEAGLGIRLSYATAQPMNFPQSWLSKVKTAPPAPLSSPHGKRLSVEHSPSNFQVGDAGGGGAVRAVQKHFPAGQGAKGRGRKPTPGAALPSLHSPILAHSPAPALQPPGRSASPCVVVPWSSSVPRPEALSGKGGGLCWQEDTLRSRRGERGEGANITRLVRNAPLDCSPFHQSLPQTPRLPLGCCRRGLPLPAWGDCRMVHSLPPPPVQMR